MKEVKIKITIPEFWSSSEEQELDSTAKYCKPASDVSNSKRSRSKITCLTSCANE